jgi:hypothetical protein
MEYCKIENGKITEYISTNVIHKGEEWREIDGSTFNGAVGMPEEWIDWKAGKLKEDDVLISEGLIVDNRGVKIYDKKTGHEFEIKALNFDIPETHTKKAPATQFDKWDGEKWVTDQADKQAYEDTIAISEARGFLNSTNDAAQEAMESGVPLIESDPELYQQRKAARDTIKSLS